MAGRPNTSASCVIIFRNSEGATGWVLLAYSAPTVRGEERTDSDLDVLVEFDRAMRLPEFAALQAHLSGLLEIKVDLAMKRALRPRICRNILKEVVEV